MAKELLVESNGFMYKLRWAGGGEIPLVLSGQYTSAREAEKAKVEYLAKKPKRKVKDGAS